MKYKEIFENVEKDVASYVLDSATLEKYKEYDGKNYSDDEIFKILIHVIFYSGFKAVTVDQKLSVIDKYFSEFKSVSQYSNKDFELIMSDSNMIRNKKKIKACIKNAKTFSEIILEYGSFTKYLHSFKAEESFETLILLKEELEYKFEYLGKITVYHFLSELGFQVLKPDRVITRVFQRLGLIESREQLLKAVIHGNKFSKLLNLNIRYIDIVFVSFGQIGEDEKLKVKKGICLEKNPRCEICKVKIYCNYKNK